MKYYSLLLTLFLASPLLASDGSAGSGSGASDAESSASRIINGSCKDTRDAWAELLEEASAKPLATHLYSTGSMNRSAEDYIALIKAAKNHSHLKVLMMGWSHHPDLSPADGDTIADAIASCLAGRHFKEVTLAFSMTDAGLTILAGVVSSWESLDTLQLQTGAEVRTSADVRVGAQRIFEAAATLRHLKAVTLSGVNKPEDLVVSFDALRKANDITTPLTVHLYGVEGTSTYNLPLADEAAASGGGSAGAGGAVSSAKAPERPEED